VLQVLLGGEGHATSRCRHRGQGGRRKGRLRREEPHGLRWAQHGLKAGCGGRQVAPVLGLVDQREEQLAEEGDETEYRASRGDGTQ
jgi:hypothetical protein